jgi:hypothetical protein
VLLKKCQDDVHPEHEAHPPVVLSPAVHAHVLIAPQEVAHDTHIEYFARPVEVGDLVQPLHLRTQPPVYAQYLLVDHCAYREAVEDVAEDLRGFAEQASPTHTQEHFLDTKHHFYGLRICGSLAPKNGQQMRRITELQHT